jgi:TolA-binding protein
MSKLTLVLALYAAAAATVGLVAATGKDGGTTETATGGGISTVDARAMVTRARQEARDEVQPLVRELEAWKGRIDSLRDEMQDQLKSIDEWIEETAQLSAGGLDDLKKRLKDFEGIGPKLDRISSEIDKLGTRVKAVEDRPPVIREVVSGPSKPDKPEETGPAVPTLPTEEQEDPAEVARQIAKATTDLNSDNPALVWSAINVVRKYQVLDAAPRLIEILQNHKTAAIQKAAAQALGAIQSCDAVPVLADAMTSTDDSLGEVASQAVREITGFDSGMASGDRIKARRKARNAVVAWWRDNEASVRERLGQPKS